MSDSTAHVLEALHADLRKASSPEAKARILHAMLDAHVSNVTGLGSMTLSSGETVFDSEKLLGVGVSLAGSADAPLRAVPLAWFEAAPGPARLHILHTILLTLWARHTPPADQVDRLHAAFALVENPEHGVTSDALLAFIESGRAHEAELDRAASPPARDARVPGLVAALGADVPSTRDRAASDLQDLLHGGLHPDDLALVVDGLLRQAAHETDGVVLESLFNALGDAANQPDSGTLADWAPLPPILEGVQDPQCLVHALAALGLTYLERHRGTILPFLQHDDPEVREAAGMAIAELDHVL